MLKRVTLFCGHYGSGKTNIAVNWALHLQKEGHPAAIADLDIVNPYFRTADSAPELRDAGVKVVLMPFANSSVDLPSLPSEVYSLVQDKSRYAVFDVGGDDRGAYALGRYAPAILEEGNYEMLYVVNFLRPLTRNAPDALEVLREIEAAGHIPFTGIVHNTNLGAETAPEDILEADKKAKELSALAGIPVAMTTGTKEICDALAGRIPALFPITLQAKYY